MFPAIVNVSKFMRCNHSSLVTANQPAPTRSMLAISSLYRYYHHHQNNHNDPIQVTWTKPEIGWKKLNFDGSSKIKEGKSSIGGVVRDHNGKFLLGYAESISSTKSSVAGLVALRRGLELVVDRRWGKKVWAEGDAEALVYAIVKKRKGRSTLEERRELSMIKEMMKLKLVNVKVTHIYREGNRTADQLAEMGHTRENLKVWINVPPKEVLSVVHDDAQGKIILRKRR